MSASLSIVGALTVNGKTIWENATEPQLELRSDSSPRETARGTRGNSRSRHLGRTVVFENIEHCKGRIENPDLAVDETCILVLKNLLRDCALKHNVNRVIFPRCSGILLHVTSLPGGQGIGDLGNSAHEFVEFLADSGQKIWQVLPLSPTGYGDSPYQCFSAFDCIPLFVDLN